MRYICKIIPLEGTRVRKTNACGQALRQNNILADDKYLVDTTHSGYKLYGQWPDLSSHESVFQSRRVTVG
jgi:hypothetical protein